MIDDDDFEERFEEFCELTDDQVDAVLEREMAEYVRWWNTLTAIQQYRISRRTAVEGCLTWRKTIRAGFDSEFFLEQLRSRQKRLLKLRIELATGVYPGSA
ncbi:MULTISPECIES: hypothetical protein [unclassified Bradyrhizobium]|uniref:hypothetical protein n=1 Tax=Bradyrhizobium sp. USDA 4541 TaxID=2817704 RepID=UPI0020A522DB|nr:hypothetical protein [Bradyrhizobium sp. USDA 4541]MCP1852754.1 hypothetical protein [Bradyrhizobium sp. USDA 4541]